MTDANKNIKKENILCHKQWSNNSSRVAKVLVLLEMLEVIKAKGWHVEEGENSIGFDHRKSMRK